MQTKIVNVTPEMAARWLKCNTSNRNLRRTQVAHFAHDMENGTWEDTHQGIAFYDDGTLADGQHRLHAVVKSGKTIKFHVTNGLPKTAGLVIDQSVRRMAHDAIRIAGGNDWIDSGVVALAKATMSNFGMDTRPQNVHEIIEYANKYRTNLTNVVKWTAKKKRFFTHSCIAASYFCALEAGEKPEKIQRFAQIMFTGQIEGPQESAVIRLREYLLINTSCWVGVERLETAKRAQGAIKAFCRGSALAQLRARSELIYPVPK